MNLKQICFAFAVVQNRTLPVRRSAGIVPLSRARHAAERFLAFAQED